MFSVVFSQSLFPTHGQQYKLKSGVPINENTGVNQKYKRKRELANILETIKMDVLAMFNRYIMLILKWRCLESEKVFLMAILKLHRKRVYQ